MFCVVQGSYSAGISCHLCDELLWGDNLHGLEPFRRQQMGVSGYDIAGPRGDGTIDELVIARILFDPIKMNCNFPEHQIFLALEHAEESS